MNKNLMPHEIKLSDSSINENDWEETYKSPMEMIVSQMSSEFDRMADKQLMLRVNQAVDFYVDKAELLKALQYDRNQYDKGYADAKKKYQRQKGKVLNYHGRLSDMDELVKNIVQEYGVNSIHELPQDIKMFYEKFINSAPTVIDATLDYKLNNYAFFRK